jgi:hypothetical protein
MTYSVVWLEKLKERDFLEDLRVDRMLLRCTLKKRECEGVD